MKMCYRISLAFWVLAGFTMMLSSGCAAFGRGKEIQNGDRVIVQVTCRLHDGTLVYTSRESDTNDPLPVRSNVYVDQREKGPLNLVAGSGYQEPLAEGFKQFENEVMGCLSNKVAGMRVHEKKHMVLKATENKGLTDKDRYLAITKTTRYPRIDTVKRQDFVKSAGKEPEVGLVVPSDPLPARVTALDKDTVSLEMAVQDGEVITTSFGPARITFDGDTCIEDMQTGVGYLVKTGPLIGRVVSVDDKRIIIDYADPFGGESLDCDVEILSVSSPVPSNPKPVNKEDRTS